MVKAYPINAKGEQIGEVKSFSDEHWNRMNSHHGKKLRYREEKSGASDNKKEKTVELISTKSAKRKDNYAK